MFICPSEVDSFPGLKDFLIKLLILTNVLLKIFYNEICQHLEVLHDLVNQ